MIGILAYGSLINPEEYSTYEGVIEAVPVTVAGFKRVFNQQPSWRKGKGSRIGVLNVEFSEEHAINAICLLFETDDDCLKEREHGYKKYSVNSSQVRCYSQFVLPKVCDYWIFIGRKEKKAEDIFPNDEYLSLCVNGANKWGEMFCKEFISTTYLANEIKLSQYIETHRKDLTNTCTQTP
jgi:hypothetical protein